MAIKGVKNKAVAPYLVPRDIPKLVEYEQLNVLTSLFNNIYNTGYLLKDWLVSIFIPFPKKKENAVNCSNHKITSRMSHALKVFRNIIHTRIYRKFVENISITQFGLGHQKRCLEFRYYFREQEMSTVRYADNLLILRRLLIKYNRRKFSKFCKTVA